MLRTPAGTAGASPTRRSSRRAISSGPHPWPPSSRRRRRSGRPPPPRQSAGAGWPSTASTAPPCAWPIRRRTWRTSGARRAATARARAIRNSASSPSSPCAPTCWPPRPSGPIAPANSRGDRGLGRPPGPRGRHPRPRLLQLRPLSCARGAGPGPLLARAGPQRADRPQRAVVQHYGSGDVLVELRPSTSIRKFVRGLWRVQRQRCRLLPSIETPHESAERGTRVGIDSLLAQRGGDRGGPREIHVPVHELEKWRRVSWWRCLEEAAMGW